MTSGLTTVTATSALNRETPTTETHKTAETHVEKRLKRLWVKIGETLKRLRSTSAGRCWLIWVSGGRKCVLGSSKAVNVACLAVFDPSTNIALSRQPKCAKKSAIIRSSTLDVSELAVNDHAGCASRYGGDSILGWNTPLYIWPTRLGRLSP
jgi:hypothetical protein